MSDHNTCLDRAMIALEAAGQYQCAAQMDLLQAAIDVASELTELDSSHPVEIVYDLVRAVEIIGLFEEGQDEPNL